MSVHEIIDLQFERSVEVVQGLPKTGPIQTDYEEKLLMYSLYKQATAGNVKSPRPGIWDMLGRAKWDAWAKHKDLDPYEARRLYVDALLKVLRKYSDKTIARALVDEIESYGGDTFNVVGRSLAKSRDSDSDSSDDEEQPARRPLASLPSIDRQADPAMPFSELGSDDEARDLPQIQLLNTNATPINRPQSSLSSHRYRTPMAGSLAMSPPPPPPAVQIIPQMQPHPGFETPSAFAEPSPISVPTSLYPTGTTGSSFVQLSEFSTRDEAISPPQLYGSNMYGHPNQANVTPYGPARPVSRPTLERAVESVQAQLAAITERLESLESVSRFGSRSHMSTSPMWAMHRDSSAGYNSSEWDLDDLGMWSLVVNPVSQGIEYLRNFTKFFARNENRSPASIILRRLCLDASFLVIFLALFRLIWRRSGVRRREVHAALVVLWKAILGSKPPRHMIDKAV